MLKIRLLLRLLKYAVQFSVCVVVALTVAPSWAWAGDLVLAGEVTNELNSLLKASDGLGRSMLSQDDEQIDLSLRDVLVQLERTKAALAFVKPHDRRHLAKILDVALEHFEQSQSTFGSERRSQFEDGFNQLANIVRIYRVDRNYSIYFCPKDRTTWVQRVGKVQNPFHSDGVRESCGIRIAR